MLSRSEVDINTLTIFSVTGVTSLQELLANI